jgi:hypothetical protein
MELADQALVKKVNAELEENLAVNNVPRGKRSIMEAGLVLGREELEVAVKSVLIEANPLRGLENPEIRVKVSDLTRDFMIRV